jgi:hypothetical protein
MQTTRTHSSHRAQHTSSTPADALSANGRAEYGLHLLVEARRTTTTSVSPKWSALALGASVMHLELGRQALALTEAAPRGPALLLEILPPGGSARLLCLPPRSARLRLNGRPAPPVALLELGDELQVGGFTVYVSEHLGGGAVPVPAELVGSPCGLCRLPFAAGTDVARCRCGEVLHLEGPPKPEAERLECALLGDCPTCSRPLKLAGGWAWLPEVDA